MRAPVASPSARTGADVVTVIARRHGRELGALHRQLFSPAGEFDPDTTPDGWRPPMLEAPAVTDRHARVTVAASVDTYVDPSENMPAGTRLLRASVAGHHRSLCTRANLSGVEEEAWARAVIGADWATHAYRQGVVAGVGGGPGAAHFLVYLDGTGRAVPGPESPGLPLRALAG